MKLVKTFKDEERIYYLTEYVPGMDLFDVLRELGLLNNKKALFYTACIVLMLENLHERDIAHRDLKPENIMIGDDGYPKLIDFGTAKIVKERTFTMVGTPHYMAPEIIFGRGYSPSSDLWSLGVMVYEFVFGNLPFGEDIDDPFEIYDVVS